MTPSKPNFQHIGLKMSVIVFLLAMRFALVMVKIILVVKVRVSVI